MRRALLSPIVLILLLLLSIDPVFGQVQERTWEQLFNPPTVVLTVHFLDLPGPPRVGFVGCSDAVYRTTDGGNTWAACTVNVPGFVAADFTFKDSLTGWFANYNYSTSALLPMCYKTTDGGLTWNGVYGPTQYCSSILYRPENHLLLLASWADGPAPQVGNSCYSTDDGATWKVFWQREKLNGFSFLDTLNGIATSANLLFLRTTDGGYTWDNVNSTGDETWQPVAIPKTSTYYASSEISGKFFDSKDLGLRFTEHAALLGNTTGTLRAGSCGSIYAQYGTGSAYRGEGVIRSLDGGNSWLPLHGPVNKNDSRLYVKGGYIFAGSIDTVTGTYGVWRYVEDSTFYDGGSYDLPQVSDSAIVLVSPDCGALDSSLSIVYLNDCSTARLVDAKLSSTSRFMLALSDTLPVRISGTYHIPILYSPVGHDGDTAILTLTYETHGETTTKDVKVIGTVPGSRTITRFQLLANGASTSVSNPGDVVPIDLMLLNDIPSSLGLNSIAFELTYDENVAAPDGFTINPPWSLLRASHTFGHDYLAFRRTPGADLAANSLVATFQFKTYLSIAPQTSIVAQNFQLNDGDSVYLGCTATATDPGTIIYVASSDSCGIKTLRKFMQGSPLLEAIHNGVRVSSPVAQHGVLTVVDLLGRTLMERDVNLTRESQLIDLATLPTGVYLVRLQSESGFRQTARAVIEH